MDFEIIHQEN